MARYKITIEYEGVRYYGWQAQKGNKTIQGEFFNAFDKIFNGQNYEFYGAGRTDSGVHALGQVAHLQVDGELPVEKLQFRINDLLPPDINVLRVEKANFRFHARHDAIARSYVYIISKRRAAFGKPYCWWIKDKLDVTAMKEVAGLMTGMHDFRSFTDQTPEEGSTLVNIHYIDLHELEDMILIHISGSHFLWKMVRRITGILVEAGRGNLSLQEAGKLLEEFSPLVSRYTAPPSGLFLHRVYYPGDQEVRGAEHLPRLLNF
jgi:tRNA pseudouridine38-40 synthase